MFIARPKYYTRRYNYAHRKFVRNQAIHHSSRSQASNRFLSRGDADKISRAAPCDHHQETVPERTVDKAQQDPHRHADIERRHIDYCLNITGIRVSRNVCQLMAKVDGRWDLIGLLRALPVEVPHDAASVAAAGDDPVRLIAYQYEREYPGRDLRAVLEKAKDFDVALRE